MKRIVWIIIWTVVILANLIGMGVDVWCRWYPSDFPVIFQNLWIPMLIACMVIITATAGSTENRKGSRS